MLPLDPVSSTRRDDRRPRPRRVGSATTRLRRAVLRRRRPLAALAAAIAVGAGLLVVAPPAPATRTVVVAARDLPAGTVLATTDLTSVDLPAAAVPAGALHRPVGDVLAGPLRRGEVVTDARVVGPGLLPEGDPRVAVPVRLSDPAQVALLEPGDAIELSATDPAAGTTTVVTDAATVLAIPPEPASGADGFRGTAGGRLVVLAVNSSDVGIVTGASVTAFVTFAWSDH